MTGSLLGDWVQDNYAVGSRRAFRFKRDGTYEFTVTAGGRVVQSETGTFSADETALALQPAGDLPRSLKYDVGRDPAVGDERLVLDGHDIFYRP